MLKILSDSTSYPEVTHIESNKTIQLPHGSGIDCSWVWDEDEGECLSFHNEYHAMDANGCYCGYIPFEVIITYINDEFHFDVSVDHGQIESIVEDYEVDEETGESNAPYLDDLADVIHSSIESWNWYLPTLRKQQKIYRNIKQIESLLVETAVNLHLVQKEITVLKLSDVIDASVPKCSNQCVKDAIFNALWSLLTRAAQNKKEE